MLVEGDVIAAGLAHDYQMWYDRVVGRHSPLKPISADLTGCEEYEMLKGYCLDRVSNNGGLYGRLYNN
jgi:hypothetical protein